METQVTGGALVPQSTNPSQNPFAKPEPVVGIIHRVGNPFQVKVNCSATGGFDIELNPGVLQNELKDVVILGFKKFDKCSFFAKTYEGKIYDWVAVFAIVPYKDNKYLTQMLMKGESMDRLISCLFAIQAQQKSLASVSFDLTFDGKTSKGGKGYKVVKFKMNDTSESYLKEIYEFAEMENAIEDINKLFDSSFLETVVQNAKIMYGKENPLYSEATASK